MIKSLKIITCGAIIVSLLGLSACGNDKKSPDDHDVISAKDGLSLLLPNQEGFVSVAPYVSTGANGAVVQEAILLSNADQCGDAASYNKMGFYTTINGAGVCEYQYTVRSLGASSHTDTAKIAVISSLGDADDLMLPPISVATELSQTVEIDLVTSLGANFPSGYELSEKLMVIGSGEAIANEPDANWIQYEAMSLGAHRVVYAVSDLISDDTKIGTLDIAVSDIAHNPPVANNGTHPEQPEINNDLVIDVTDYVDAPNNIDFQLVDVKSFNASVTPVDLEDMYNKEFVFNAPVGGEHYVAYTVSDHLGGFDSGILEVTALDPTQSAKWLYIQLDANQIYVAPLTVSETGDVTHRGHYDGAYYPPIKVATYDFSEAQALCDALGRLPTKDELLDLYANEVPSIKHNWPVEMAYFADDAGAATTVNLSNGSVAAPGAQRHYVTCIGSIYGLSASIINDDAVADGMDKAIVEVSLTIKGVPLEGEELTASVVSESANARLDSATEKTDVDGKALFHISNITAEPVQLTVEYTTEDDTQAVVETVMFVGDVNTAELVDLEVIHDFARPDGTEFNSLIATVVDSYENPVEGRLVEFSIDDSATASLVEDPSSLLTDSYGQVTATFTNSVEEAVSITATHESDYIGITSLSDSIAFINSAPPIDNDGVYWLPPFSYEDASDLVFAPDGSHTETGASGPDGMEVSQFVQSNAVRFCEELDYLLKSDWRLPTIEELKSLHANEGNMWVNHQWAASRMFWSTTENHTNNFDTINLQTGFVMSFPDSGVNVLSVSCVR